jgi:MFS-type transporter involved in bile tolerance (Atg22 family)
LLIQLFSAPAAIFIDSVSFIVSAVMTLRIRKPEPVPASDQPALPFVASVKDGFRSLLKHPLLRPIILTSIADGLFHGAIVALFIVFASRELELSPILIGLIFAVGGLCAVPGAMRAAWAATRFGVGPAILGGWLLEATARLAIPLVSGPAVVIVVVLTASQAVVGATGTIANIHQWSLRQAVTPDHLQGRVTASQRFLVYGATAIGAIFGGLNAWLRTRAAPRPAPLRDRQHRVPAPRHLVTSPDAPRSAGRTRRPADFRSGRRVKRATG